MVSGIFYEEPIFEGRDDFEEQIKRVYDKLLTLSEGCGYRVLRDALKLRDDQPDPTL